MAKINNIRLLPLAILFISSLLTSCFKEDFSDCPRRFQLFIKALDADNNDITASGDVKNVVLFIFDENNDIVDALEITEKQIIEKQPIQIGLEYLNHNALNFVAVGNLDKSKLDAPEIKSVKKRADLFISLKQQASILSTRIAQPTCMSPGDVFYGDLHTPVEKGSLEDAAPKTIEINRKASSVTISAFNLKEWNQNKDGKYTFRLKETHKTLNNEGKLVGDMINYMPACNMNNEGVLIAPLFTAFPTTQGKGYTLEILFEGDVIYTTDKDSQGNEFIPQPGRTLNIIIDFSVNILVIAKITPWNVVYQYVVL